MKKLLLLLLFIPLVSFGQNNLNFNSQESIKKYFDLNGVESIEGIWEYSGERSDFSNHSTHNSFGVNYVLAIIKSGNKYNAHIIGNDVFRKRHKPGDLKATLRKSASNKVFTIDWLHQNNKHRSRIPAVLENDFLIKFSINQGRSVLYRSYPEDIKEKTNVKYLNSEKFDSKSETSIRKYFDDNETHSIEGIWEYTSGGNESYKLAITKKDYKFYASIIESSEGWEPGEIKAEIEPSASKSIMTIRWTMGDKKTIVKTIAKVTNDALMEFDLVHPENPERANPKVMLYKAYPQLQQESKNSKLKKGEWAGNGSGVIISKSGYIITNHHVIEDADDIEVEFILNDEVQKFNAEIVQVDKTNDLAIVKIVDVNFDGVGELPYNFKTRSSDVGTKVYAFGYPMALSIMGKEIKVTDGMISSKTGFDGNITTYQITAPIQGGNSGGPLFDEKGNLIGINSSGIRKDIASNVAYSIKTSYVLNLIDILPKSIELPSNTKLESLPLTEQIKEISKYVVLIKVK